MIILQGFNNDRYHHWTKHCINCKKEGFDFVIDFSVAKNNNVNESSGDKTSAVDVTLNICEYLFQ